MNSPVIVRNGLSLPLFSPGMRIGLFGGTFDPPHNAHFGASLLAMKRLKLDRVWWLVTPGNPLKDTSRLAPLPERIAQAHALTHHPRIDISGIEAVIKTRYSHDTLAWLVRRCPGVRFVWIMGADNLRSFHRWQRWREIAKLVPFVVVDRLGPSLYAAASPAAHALSRWRIPDHAAPGLPNRKAPAWAYLHGLKSGLSSTALRALRGKNRSGGKSATATKTNKPAKPPAEKKGGTAAGKSAAKTSVTKPSRAARRTAAAKAKRPGGKKPGGKKRR